MHFAGEFRTIGKVDVAAARAIVAQFDDAHWDAEAKRQQTYKVHALTRTIPLIFDADMRHQGPTIHPLFAQFEAALAPAMTAIQDHYAQRATAASPPPPPGYFIRILLVKLAAGGEIPSHKDSGPSLSRAHRIHFPIITNDRVLFAVAGNIRHMAAGELCEINNRKSHAVRNGGADRVHAIFDYVVPGEAIDDPDGSLIA